MIPAPWPGPRERAGGLARDGFRGLAVAAADRPAVPDVNELEQGLRPLGLIGITDPPRRTAAANIASCRAAGITPVLITGDHPATADAIAAELGILHPGNDVIDCTDPAADLADPRARVFARATPEQKLAIITARQAAGDVVAMTGDGVNDGPALRRADIGVAMGRRGTEVARQAADLVLADDNLQTVVTAAGEGRRVYGSICRFLLYGLSGGSAEIAVMLAGPALGLALPLLPAQILWVNLLTCGLPGVALGGEPAEPGIMTRPPGRRPKACSAPGCGSGSSGSASWSPRSPWASPCGATPPGGPGRVWPSSRSAPPSSPSRSDRGPGPAPWPTRCCPLPSPPPWRFRGAGLYLPFLRELLHTEPLTGLDLLVVFLASTPRVRRGTAGPHQVPPNPAPRRSRAG